MTAIADDESRMELANVAERLRTALDSLKAIATSGDVEIDRHIMEAEQAARRANIAVNKKLGKY